MSLEHKATERFGDRVQDYIAYRPSYPKAIVGLLSEKLGLEPGHVVADIGSGTGLLSELFLENGNAVFGVEPNEAMREAGETLLAEYELFHSVAGSAEMTDLAADSINFIIAAQAFHWFEPVAARREFERILKPGGWVVAIWNMRRTTGSPFSVAYEKFLLRWGTDYSHVASLYGAAGPLGAFFADGGFEMDSIYSEQILDYEALEGRLLSSSYIPRPDDPDDSPLLAALREMYVDHERRGTVTMEYDTQIFYGRLD